MGTGGFYGVGETVAHSFHEEREREREREPRDTPPSLWHVLPYTKKVGQRQEA